MRKDNIQKLIFSLSMFVFGTIGVFVKNVSLSSGEIALYRAIMAIIFLSALFVVKKQKFDFSKIKKEIPILFLSGAAMGLNWILLFEAYKFTTVSVATLSYYFAPVIVTILCPVLFKEKIKAIRAVQFEESEYNHVQDKLRKNIPLNEKEQDFYYFILDSMEDTESSRVLWRNVAPYDGFVEQIRQGELDFKGLSSTASNYTDFFDFWQCADVGVVGKKLQVQESYMLKINVKKGTPVLDCSAIHKRAFRKPIYPRMYGEVVLPEGKGIVKSIDNDLRIIEVDFCM